MPDSSQHDLFDCFLNQKFTGAVLNLLVMESLDAHISFFFFNCTRLLFSRVRCSKEGC